MKSTNGVDRGDGIIINRGNKDLRKLTCPRCRGTATASRSVNGRMVTKCHRCGTEFSSKPL